MWGKGALLFRVTMFINMCAKQAKYQVTGIPSFGEESLSFWLSRKPYFVAFNMWLLR